MIRNEIIDTKVCGKHFNLFYFMGTYNYEVIYGMLFCMLWIERMGSPRDLDKG